MNIEIVRYHIKGELCDSHLSIDGTKVCDCAENALHRTPAGIYTVVLRFSNIANRKVPILIPAEDLCQIVQDNFPIIMVGNGVHSLHNQILVGKQLVPGVVIHSFDAFLPLYDRINNAIRRGNRVTLIITEK